MNEYILPFEDVIDWTRFVSYILKHDITEEKQLICLSSIMNKYNKVTKKLMKNKNNKNKTYNIYKLKVLLFKILYFLILSFFYLELQ